MKRQCAACGAGFERTGGRQYYCSNTCRFWSQVDRGEPETCWPFTAASRRREYGSFKIGGKTVRAHRMAYFLSNGTLPSDDVLHTCDNPLCCNPGHLYLGTDVENARDRVTRNRTATGERHGLSKLTGPQVIAIRQRLAAGELQAQIAEWAGVTVGTIRHIKAGRTWGHIQ